MNDRGKLDWPLCPAVGGLPPPTLSIFNPYEFPLYTFDELEKRKQIDDKGNIHQPRVDIPCGGLMRLPVTRMRHGQAFILPRGLTTHITSSKVGGGIRHPSKSVMGVLEDYRRSLLDHIARRPGANATLAPFFKIDPASGQSRDARREENWLISLVDQGNINAEFGPTQDPDTWCVLSEGHFSHILDEMPPTPPALVVPRACADKRGAVMRALGYQKLKGITIISHPYGDGFGYWFVNGLVRRRPKYVGESQPEPEA